MTVFMFMSATGAARANGPVIRRAWQEVYSTPQNEWSYGVAMDQSGGIYVSGYTYGQLGSVSYGSADAFLAKILPDGSRAWDIQFGTSQGDKAYDVACGMDGSVYVAGITGGSMHGSAPIGDSDAFVVKYNSDGQRLWTRQFGSARADSVWAVTTDPAGSVYVAGHRRQADNSWDTYVTKLSSDGSELWTWESGIDRSDYGFDVSVDAMGNVFVGGAGYPAPGYSDIYVTKLNAGGGAEWTKVFDVHEEDRVNDVEVDGLGNYVWSEAEISGFMRLFPRALAYDDEYGFAVAGYADDFSGVGGYNIFVERYEFVPEPGTLGLLALGGFALLHRGRRA